MSKDTYSTLNYRNHILYIQKHPQPLFQHYARGRFIYIYIYIYIIIIIIIIIIISRSQPTAGQRPPLIFSKTPVISPVVAKLPLRFPLFHPAIFYLVSSDLSTPLLESSQSVFCSIYCPLFWLHDLPISTFVP